MSNPVEKLEQSIGHMCQTGCGNRADVVLVQLATAETDILCQPCHATMMLAVISQLPDPESLQALAEQPAGT